MRDRSFLVRHDSLPPCRSLFKQPPSNLARGDWTSFCRHHQHSIPCPWHKAFRHLACRIVQLHNSHLQHKIRYPLSARKNRNNSEQSVTAWIAARRFAPKGSPLRRKFPAAISLCRRGQDLRQLPVFIVSPGARRHHRPRAILRPHKGRIPCAICTPWCESRTLPRH